MCVLGLLQSAIARPPASFEGGYLYPDLFTQAAALLDSLARNHPFVDGDKRTAIAAAAIFLRSNGFQLTALNKEVITFMMAVALGKMSIEAMTDWLRHNSILG